MIVDLIRDAKTNPSWKFQFACSCEVNENGAIRGGCLIDLLIWLGRLAIHFFGVGQNRKSTTTLWVS